MQYGGNAFRLGLTRPKAWMPGCLIVGYCIKKIELIMIQPILWRIS